MTGPNPPAEWKPPWPWWLNLSWLGVLVAPWVRLLIRLVVGAFLIWGVWDNIIDPFQMSAFAAFLDENGFIWPGLMAHLAVYAQLACGLAFIVGMLVRWAGLICAIIFTVAVVFVEAKHGVRAAMPATLLALIGLDMLARGPGPFNLRALLVRR
ncbi:MAG: DoxX family protein [Phenylobacterium sp.]|uniref:DoxX family protein n=1 Tax=Phenylobacterium sp. TaxID=1871053 RepID=UPI00271EADA7|nr:DoxX family protein [Phenylobacterium sp.]MDO8901373.1 DoxX family protein [Phenylobacterium sp.]MDP2212509.1 DoxX family protein [Phenylobacterium sp.]